METIKTLSTEPFRHFITTIGELPTSFTESMSYYELLAWLCNYIEKQVVPTVNGTVEGLKELQEYVANYFDNLDVQTEIDNKLDEMAENGELMELISTYLGISPLLCFNTIADAQASENLTAGSTFRTLGKETLDDGYGAVYKVVSTSTPIALANSLYAELVPNYGGNNYYKEVTITTGRLHDTDYRYATIPLNDTDGNLIGCYVNEDENASQGPLGYADSNFTTVTINAGLGRLDSNDEWKQGAVIANGVILHGDECDIPTDSRYGYIGIKADRTVLSFPGNTTPQQMLAAGVKDGFLCWGTIVTEGQVDIDEAVDPTSIHPWMNLGVKPDGTIIIFSSDGSTAHDTGMTMQQSAEFMISLGCATVFRLDGGGSSSLVYKGSKQNRNIDNVGSTERGIWVTLNFKKETIDKQLAEVYSFVGKERHLMNKQIRQDVDARYQPRRAFTTLFQVATGINKITEADTWTNLQFSDSLSNQRTDEDYTLIKNESNRTIGIEFNKLGIYEVCINCLIVCANVAGDRGLRIDSPLGTAITNHASSTSNYAPTAASTNFEKNLISCFNITTAGTKVYFCGKGKVNDDFNRINLTIRQIGPA